MYQFSKERGKLLQTIGIEQIVYVSVLLGAVGGLCCGVLLYAWMYSSSIGLFSLSLYILVVHICFHLTEFIIAVRYRPHDIDVQSFMIFHSTSYLIASGLAFVEFFVKYAYSAEIYFFPLVLKLNYWTSCAFAFLALCFYGFRIIAMIHCGENFSLNIEENKRRDHRLVTNGIYAVLRHPSYFGWFWRTLLAQLIIGNTVSCLLHTIITWYFFKKRIRYEEQILESEEFFGESYQEYKSKTYIGIPLL